MNKTLKYVLIGGAVAATVYYVAKRVMPAPEPKPSLGGGAGQVINGLQQMWEIVSLKPPPPPDNSPASTFPVVTGDDSAVADAGMRNMQVAVLQPYNQPSYAQRALGGTLDTSQYKLGSY